MAHPALQPPAQAVALGRGGGRQAGVLAARARIGADQPGRALFFIGAQMGGDHRRTGLDLRPAGGVPVVQGQRRVGLAASLADRGPAVALLGRGRAEQIDRTRLGLADQHAAVAAATGKGCIPGHQTGGFVAFVQGDHPGQGARAIGAGPGSAHQANGAQAFSRQAGPDHPAAERIVLRHTVQGHQGAARRRGGDGAQGNALGRRVGPRAGARPEQRGAGRGFQHLVQTRGRRQVLGADLHDGKGRIGRRRRQARRAHHDFSHWRRVHNHHLPSPRSRRPIRLFAPFSRNGSARSAISSIRIQLNR